MSIFIPIKLFPADVLPAEERPLSLPGEERSSGVTGGGERRDP